MSDFYLFWIQHNARPLMAPSLVEQIFQPRNRQEFRARLAAHRRRWKKKAGH